MNDLITKIQSELPGFSKGQKQIARFILEHYDKAAFMTASRLGVTVGVSTADRAARGHGHDPRNARRDRPRRLSGCGGCAHGR